MNRHQLAQINVARLLAPIDAPETADFVAALEPVNARADRAEGFVWRLQTAEGNATAVQAFDDPLVIVNLSVWESIEALEAFAYGDESHRAVLRRGASGSSGISTRPRRSGGSPPGRRRRWTRPRRGSQHLRTHGPTQHAFTFRERFSAP